MESFESEEQNLLLDVLGNGETVKLDDISEKKEIIYK